MVQVPPLAYEEHWHIELDSLRAESKAILKKHPEASEAIERVRGILRDVASLAGCTPKKTGESEEWVSVVHLAEADRVRFCRALEGKSLLTALYGVYSITLN
jgi:hypothetical protein